MDREDVQKLSLAVGRQTLDSAMPNTTHNAHKATGRSTTLKKGKVRKLQRKRRAKARLAGPSGVTLIAGNSRPSKKAMRKQLTKLKHMLMDKVRKGELSQEQYSALIYANGEGDDDDDDEEMDADDAADAEDMEEMSGDDDVVVNSSKVARNKRAPRTKSSIKKKKK